LLARHFAFFGGLAVVGAAAPRATATLKTGVLAALDPGAALRAVLAGILRRHLPAFQARAPIDDTLPAVAPLFLALVLATISFIRRRIYRLLGHSYL